MQEIKTKDVTVKLLASMPESGFDSPMAERLEARYKHYVGTSTKPGTLTVGSHSLNEFYAFAKELFRL